MCGDDPVQVALCFVAIVSIRIKVIIIIAVIIITSNNQRLRFF